MAAPGTFHFYAANASVFKLSDLASANLRMALVTSAYTPNITATGHNEWADVSTNELANGNGYTTGGDSLTGTVAADAGNDGFKLSSENAQWTASGAGIPAWRYAVLYGALWGLTSPLVGYFLGDSAPADVPLTASGNVLQLNCPADGWGKLTSS